MPTDTPHVEALAAVNGVQRTDSLACGHRAPRLWRLAVDAAELAKLLGVGVRTVRTLDYAGKLPRSVRLGARVVWYLPEIRAWLATGAPPRAEWEALRAARRNRKRR